MPNILIDHAALVNFGRALLRAAQVPDEAADLVADSLGANESTMRDLDCYPQLQELP